jgi:hypothetical protein
VIQPLEDRHGEGVPVPGCVSASVRSAETTPERLPALPRKEGSVGPQLCSRWMLTAVGRGIPAGRTGEPVAAAEIGLDEIAVPPSALRNAEI